MSIPDDVGKASLSVIDALRSEPLSLALVLMNLALLGVFWFILSTVANQREREVALMYEDKKTMSDLISKQCLKGVYP